MFNSEKPHVSLTKKPKSIREITPNHILDELIPNQYLIEPILIDKIETDTDIKSIIQQKLILNIYNNPDLQTLFFHETFTPNEKMVIADGNIALMTTTYVTSSDINAIQEILTELATPNSTIGSVIACINKQTKKPLSLHWFTSFKNLLVKLKSNNEPFIDSDLYAYKIGNTWSTFPSNLHNTIMDYVSQLLYRERYGGETISDDSIEFIMANIQHDTSEYKGMTKWLSKKNKFAALLYARNRLSNNCVMHTKNLYKIDRIRHIDVVILMFTILTAVIMSGASNFTMTIVFGFLAILTIRQMIVHKDEHTDCTRSYRNSVNNLMLQYFQLQKGILHHLYS
ncbi:hypothetical protein J6A31_06005 [bacterium]|nr:hypothetical protein [bacterium]